MVCASLAFHFAISGPFVVTYTRAGGTGVAVRVRRGPGGRRILLRGDAQCTARALPHLIDDALALRAVR
jgi:hypothetical protein